MQIESICVTNHICGGFEQVSMGRNAETKSLPFLSVVQSTHGSYRIALDDGPALETGEMGVFVAPRARMQHLLHIPDERDGTMSAQWIFLDVEVNRRYRLDDLFLFPTVLPEKYHQDIYVLLRRIAATERLTDRLPDIHRLLCILLEVAMPMKSVPEDVIRLRNYIENHFPTRYRQLTWQTFCTAPVRACSALSDSHSETPPVNTSQMFASGTPNCFCRART